MEAGELIAEARGRADDVGTEALYSDSTFLGWLSEAQEEAAVRARLFYDDSSRFTRITLAAGRSTYPLDPRIFFVDAAHFIPVGAGRTRSLEVGGIDKLRERRVGVADTGRVCQVAQVNKTLRVSRTPTAEHLGTVQLAVYRLPLNRIEDAGDELEIPVEHQLGLVDWVIFRAFSQKDSEKEDPQRAAKAELDFERRFGPRRDADALRRHHERRQVTTSYGGY